MNIQKAYKQRVLYDNTLSLRYLFGHAGLYVLISLGGDYG